MSSSECPWKVKWCQGHSKHVTKETAGGRQKQTKENKEIKKETKENKQNNFLDFKRLKIDSFNYQNHSVQMIKLATNRFIAPETTSWILSSDV